MAMNSEIGEFLRSRRARIQPADVGLPEYGQRRVPGLRREELAQLAGVSVDYYMRLEQGRAPAVSDAVLNAIASALGLDETEQAHLRNLARPPREPRQDHMDNVRPGLRRMMRSLPDTPAFVIGKHSDIIGWNALGDALYGLSEMSPADRNAARHTFLDPHAADFYVDWKSVAAETVALLRLEAGRRPDDKRLAALIGELSMKSEPFRKLWAQHSVREKTHGVKQIRHPIAGELDLSYETLVLPGDPDQVLVIFTAPGDSPTEERLRLLASWVAPD